MEWLLFGSLAITIVCVIINIVILVRRGTNTSFGELIIDLSDPEKDTFRLALEEDLESLAKRKHVDLKVIVKTNNSQQ